MRKRSRDDHTRRLLSEGVPSEGETVQQQQSKQRNQQKSTIHMFPNGSARHVRRRELLRLSLLLGIISSLAVTTASDDIDARFLRDRRREADRKIRERFLNTQEGCIDVIVTFASGSGNVDHPEFGASDFTRTKAKAMRCVSETFYNSLFNTAEVLLVELDAKIEPAQITPVIVNNEMIPWGATTILEDSWDAIPDPQTPTLNANSNGQANANAISICIVDSGLLVEHHDIVSV